MEKQKTIQITKHDLSPRYEPIEYDYHNLKVYDRRFNFRGYSDDDHRVKIKDGQYIKSLYIEDANDHFRTSHYMNSDSVLYDDVKNESRFRVGYPRTGYQRSIENDAARNGWKRFTDEISSWFGNKAALGRRRADKIQETE